MNYIFPGTTSVVAEEGDWPVVIMSTDPTCLFDVSVYIVDLFERFRYANICSMCLKAF